MVHLTSADSAASVSQAAAGSDAASKEAKKPFWVECRKCRHQWAAAYLPMEASLFAKAAKATCPMCGNGPNGIFVAKQEDGVLTEPSAANEGKR